jgi:hypothetical protein
MTPRQMQPLGETPIPDPLPPEPDPRPPEPEPPIPQPEEA